MSTDDPAATPAKLGLLRRLEDAWDGPGFERLADRVTFRLRDVKAPRAIAVPVQSEPNDVPTAATKGMAPKGATSKGDT